MSWPRRTSSGPFEVAVVLGVAVVIVSLLTLGQKATQSWGIQPLPPPTIIAGPIPIPAPNHPYLFQPASARVAIGVKYRFSLATECGLASPVGPDFDGTFWDPVKPGQASGGPPAGFRAPVDQGYMVLVSAGITEFHSSGGITVRFIRHPGTVIASLCA